MPYDLPSDTPERYADLRRVEHVARLLDTRYRLPGTRFRFGFDSILGLVPGLGDTLALLPSLWMIWIAWKHGIPRATLFRMGANTGLDYVVGSIPVVGNVFDFFFKANRRNAQALAHAMSMPPGPDA